MAPLDTPAILLRQHDYGETSRVLRFYTRDLGVVGVMARGIRSRGSKGQAGAGTFARGILTLYVKEGRGLQTLRDFAPESARGGLSRDLLRFGGASVLSELVLRHGEEEASPPLFDLLDRSLDVLDGAPREDVLALTLALGWSLVSTLGWAPHLESCVACGREVEGGEMGRFDFEAGGIRCASCSGEEGGPRVGPGAREQLRILLAGRPPDPLTLPEAHLRLFSDFVTWHVSGGRPLQSLRFLASMIGGDGSRSEADGPGEGESGAEGGLGG